MSWLVSEYFRYRDRIIESSALWQYRRQIEVFLSGMIGFGLTAPFVKQSFPISIPLAALTLVPIAIHILMFGKADSISRCFRADPLVLLLGFALSIYYFAALKSEMEFVSSVWITFIYGLFYTLLAISLRALADRDLVYPIIIQYFTISVSMTAVLAAVVGLYKMVVYREGVILDFVASSSSGVYPYGTSLLSDYNFYSLTLLLGTLFLGRAGVESSSSSKSFLLAFLCSVVVIAGIYSGSRRFIILVPVLLPIMIIYRSIHCYKQRLFVHRFSFVMGAAFGIALVFTVLAYSGGIYNRNLEAQVDTLSGQNFGMSSRLDRWKYATKLISENNLWQIHDFNYRKEFGCKFVDCLYDDYPHSPILSAALYGGAAGILSVLLFYIYLGCVLYQLVKARTQHLEIALAVTAVTIFTAISGDTLFSVPVLVGSLIVARLVVSAKNE